ncbi:hypothetical protein ES692_06070 [Psychroserpens burtonensis]|uniref:Uncharacterized protein n=1 Tax=Psychroserpens burtonensis TaxID=49278 RepID=A0A5C7BAD6_9FLAO|nr:hypothetical protein [Psychroserpens burtonensis]TXE18607.1 hypothetical protein ES692_06070 [Psychroserpens burtonensis]
MYTNTQYVTNPRVLKEIAKMNALKIPKVSKEIEPYLEKLCLLYYKFDFTFKIDPTLMRDFAATKPNEKQMILFLTKP